MENLVNSFDETLSEPEHLRTPDDLVAFLNEHGVSVPGSLGATELEQARLLRMRASGPHLGQAALFKVNTGTADPRHRSWIRCT